MDGDVRDPGRPILPPPFEALRHEGAGGVLERAVALAPEHGAGTLVWRLAPGAFALAVVLEPDRPLAEARAAFLICMGAALEAVAAHCAPERPVAVRWPDVLVFDNAVLGRGRLVWPPGCGEAQEPEWLVFGLDLVADRDGLADPGRQPEVTSLREEGFDDPLDILESFARHLMLRFDLWSTAGLEPAARPYLDRIEGMGHAATAHPTGDLLERRADGSTRRHALAEALR
jgi:biotin-(acetyl-CoA carboxylase) ligase